MDFIPTWPDGVFGQRVHRRYVSSLPWDGAALTLLVSITRSSRLVVLWVRQPLFLFSFPLHLVSSRTLADTWTPQASTNLPTLSLASCRCAASFSSFFYGKTQVSRWGLCISCKDKLRGVRGGTYPTLAEEPEGSLRVTRSLRKRRNPTIHD